MRFRSFGHTPSVTGPLWQDGLLVSDLCESMTELHRF